MQAADRYAVVVTGASGGQVYAEKYDKWRTSFLATLKQKFGYPDDHVFVLAEQESGDASRATRDNVRRRLRWACAAGWRTTICCS